ncbi:MAG: hypothetical protein DRR06_16985 [Gammaproteobacteria bacterium]|nr:MAG: hypothetical protein DRR06_16985 [Gammaproteobacteria bacterium]
MKRIVGTVTITASSHGGHEYIWRVPVKGYLYTYDGWDVLIHSDVKTRGGGKRIFLDKKRWVATEMRSGIRLITTKGTRGALLTAIRGAIDEHGGKDDVAGKLLKAAAQYGNVDPHCATFNAIGGEHGDEVIIDKGATKV